MATLSSSRNSNSLPAEQDISKGCRDRQESNAVVLLLGGNQGDRVAILKDAIARISKQIGTVSLLSSVYETEPWGFSAEQNFLNQAVVVDTSLSAQEVLDAAMRIEKDLGRIRPAEAAPVVATSVVMATDVTAPVVAATDSLSHDRHYSSRPIDIDLIFYNSDVVDSPSLQLPHPRMHLRRFVLTPLDEIIPDFQHPKFHKSVHQMLMECSDNGTVKKYF